MREYKESQHTLLYKSNSDLSFYSAGYEECGPGYSYGPKFRAYQLIHFVINGSGRLHINEHPREMLFSFLPEKFPTTRHPEKIPGPMRGSVLWGLIQRLVYTSS